MPSSLTLLAGPDALRLVRERGLRAEDVDVIPAASGGPKWLVLAGLDRYLFGELLRAPRTRPLHLIGSSIGSWRMACLAQRDPVAALARAHEAYLEQRYPRGWTPAMVTAESVRVLDALLGATGVDDIVAHPWAKLHVITTACRGAAASDRKALLLPAMILAAAGNLVSRRALRFQLRRAIFHTAGDASPFRGLADFPTIDLPLTRENLAPALLASASIPMLLQGVRIPGAPRAVYRDGGIVDYHPDLDFGAGEGIVLYPHFYPHLVPGWFDKSLHWRRSRGANLRRALIIAPSASFVAGLRFGRIPDRRDFWDHPDTERIPAWRSAIAASQRLGDELGELVATGRIAEAVRPL